MTINEVKLFLDKLDVGDDVTIRTTKYSGKASFLSRTDKVIYFLENDFFKLLIKDILEIKMS